MSLKLIIYPNDILRTVCSDLTEKPSESLINDMFQLVNEKKGVGLAAPQIGLAFNLFILKTKMDKIVFINPKITYYSKKECSMEEGYLSLPGESVEIIRPEMVTVEYMDKEFKKRITTFGGINARIVQHEADHLLGKLIIDSYSE